MTRNYHHLFALSGDFRLLGGLVALVFLLGGSARSDSSTLLIIRPVAVALFMYWLIRLNRDKLSEHRWFAWFAGALFVLTFIHLVPLPPAWWHSLPGRDALIAVDRVLGTQAAWRPLAISPENARNALFALFIPAATGLGMMHLSKDERRSLLPIILVFGIVSLTFSLLQAALPGAKMLWFHRITNDGYPVGLFANRNHNAIFLACMIPMAAVWMHRSPTKAGIRIRLMIAGGLTVLSGFAIAASGSRAGLLAFIIAVAGSAFLVDLSPMSDQTKRGSSFRSRFPMKMAALTICTVAVLGLLGWLAMLGTNLGNAANRLSTTNSDEFRTLIWSRTSELARDYAPLGSGAGSFVEAYKILEPTTGLTHQYVNHAHNDYVEIALTLGIPGVLLTAGFILLLIIATVRQWRTSSDRAPGWRQARAASVILALILLASLVDYPIRTPAMSLFAVITLFWLFGQRDQTQRTSRAVASDRNSV